MKACDWSPDLRAGLTRQPVVTEQPAQLPHPLTGLAPHLPDPGGQRGVGADVARALTMIVIVRMMSMHDYCHREDDANELFSL